MHYQHPHSKLPLPGTVWQAYDNNFQQAEERSFLRTPDSGGCKGEQNLATIKQYTIPKKLTSVFVCSFSKFSALHATRPATCIVLQNPLARREHVTKMYVNSERCRID